MLHGLGRYTTFVKESTEDLNMSDAEEVSESEALSMQEPQTTSVKGRS
jgi:hypothetical protein